jgi:endo-1,4-beta-xylanase
VVRNGDHYREEIWGYSVGSTWVANSGLMASSGTMRPAMTWLMDLLGR